MEARKAHLRLHLDLDAEPVSGRIGAENAELRGFIGYMGLIAALQSIRAGESEPEVTDERDVSTEC